MSILHPKPAPWQARLVGWKAELEDAGKQNTLRGLKAERSLLLENRTAARSHGTRSFAAELKTTVISEAEPFAGPEASWSPIWMLVTATDSAPTSNLRDCLRSRT